jgi:hypothetical protein
VAARLEPLFFGGEIATCGILDLELLFSARTRKDYLATLADQRSLARAEVGETGLLAPLRPYREDGHSPSKVRRPPHLGPGCDIL